jgi:menaquinone-dependent protoporphyrinogen oxidase
MTEILIVYSTTDGHTREICDRLCEVIKSRGHQVSLTELTESTDPDPSSYDKVVIGASIRYGKHRPWVYRYIQRHLVELEARPSAFFSVNVVARKPEKNTPETNPYFRKFLKQITWKPAQLAVFAGKLDYPSYGFLDRQIIRFIMWMTKGPTAADTVVDFTDWRQVEAFGEVISDM